MPDELLTYAIIGLNLAVQLMLLRQLKFPPGARRKYATLAVAIPLVLMLSMRLLVAAGVIQPRVIDQSVAEQMLTAAAGILLIAGPVLVTLAAILDGKRRAWVAANRAEPEQTK